MKKKHDFLYFQKTRYKDIISIQEVEIRTCESFVQQSMHHKMAQE